MMNMSEQPIIKFQRLTIHYGCVFENPLLRGHFFRDDYLNSRACNGKCSDMEKIQRNGCYSEYWDGVINNKRAYRTARRRAEKTIVNT